MDVVSETQRSYIMSRVKGRETKPELLVRSALHGLGFRFTVNGPKNKRLPGKPDLVFPARRTVLFVHGCFWHAHKGCRDFRLPATRTDYWRSKIEGNLSRDHRNYSTLNELGWQILVVWTCALRRAQTKQAAVRAIAGILEDNGDLKHLEIGDPRRQGLTVSPLRINKD